MKKCSQDLFANWMIMYLFSIYFNLHQIQSKRKLFKMCQSTAIWVKSAGLPDCYTSRVLSTGFTGKRITVPEGGSLRQALYCTPLHIVDNLCDTKVWTASLILLCLRWNGHATMTKGTTWFGWCSAWNGNDETLKYIDRWSPILLGIYRWVVDSQIR